ncbi:MAG TPA: serine hydrolase domain-containing protein [Tepidiformaceae bacterium]|nr:serine hydrolase domain-containing protein [Tepidiformaceae bacterium]
MSNLSRSKLWLVIAACLAPTVLGAAPGTARTASVADTASVNPSELRAFVDSVITAEMAHDRIPGAGFVFVQNGRVVLQRGYGLADVASGRSVVPESTIWRVGSISKVFTATAVMQLVDRGRVDLDAPVDRYVHRVTIPRIDARSVHVRDLLDHTAGFDEIRPGTQAATSDSVQPLARFLQGKLVRLRPPGRTTAYSTYGITLAGELIEEVAAMPYEEYLKRNIWRPLGMARTAVTVPPDGPYTARGYEIEGDSLVRQGWEWYHTIPASSVNATVSDMARFMEAQLGMGAVKGARVLSEKAAREMQRQQVTMDPSIPGYALGFYEDFVGDLRVLEHGGNVAGFSALMVLIPSARAGFFVVSHFEGASLRNNLKWALLERFFPEARARRPVPPKLPAADQVRADRFAGRYASLISCWSCEPVRASGVTTVTANADGTLTFGGGRWIWVDSLRFVRENGSGYIVFRADSSGAIRELFAGAFWGWQRIPE